MSIKINRETRVRIALIVGFIAFFFAGWDSLDNNNLLLAVSNFCLAAANLLSLYFIKEKASIVNIVLLMLNSCLAFIVAYGYFNVGKKALPLAWVLVGFVYLAVTIRAYKKSKQKIMKQETASE